MFMFISLSIDRIRDKALVPPDTNYIMFYGLIAYDNADTLSVVTK